MNEHIIACKIRRGGFQSERAFEITSAEGEQKIGTAYIEHLLSSTKEQLGNDEPPKGQTIDGFVKCRMLRQLSSDHFLVQVPSGDVVIISDHQIEELHSKTKEFATR